MSLSSRSARKALAVAGIGAAAAIASVGTAEAATIQLKYLCNYPLIGIEPIDADVVASIPDEWPVNRPTGQWAITATAKTSENTWTGLNTLKGKRLETVENIEPLPGEPNGNKGIEAAAKVILPPATPGGNPSVTNVFPLLGIEPFTVPARKQVMTLVATGTTPTITLVRAGAGQITIGNLAMNLRLYDSAGAAIDVEKTLDDQNLDNDPSTFEVYCAPATAADEILDDDDNPTGEFYEDQNLTLTNIDLVDQPNKPGKPSAVVTGTSAVVKWGASTLPRATSGQPARTVAKYEFFRADTGAKVGEAPGHANTVVAGTEQTATLTGLPSGTYALNVKAVEANAAKVSNASPDSDPITVGTAPNGAPTAPGAVVNSNLSTTGVTLTWGASTDPDGDAVKYVISGIGADREVTGTTTTLTGLTPNTQYTGTVKAVDAKGLASTGTAAVSFKTNPVPNVKPSAPGTPAASAITASGATVSWGAATDSDGTIASYEVVVNGGAPQTVTSPTINLTGLSASTPYTVVVRAKDNAGEFGPTSQVTFNTIAGEDTVKPTVPTNLRLDGAPTCTSVGVTWNASTDNVGVTKYQVAYDDVVIDVAAPNLKATLTQGINEDGEYFVRVRALDAKGNFSAWSPDLQVLTPVQCGTNTPPTAPGDVTLTGFTATTATLAFGPATDDKAVVAYDVFDGPEMPGANLLASNATSPITVTELTTGKAYTLYVRARDAAGERGPAKTVQVTPRDRDTVAPSQPGAITTSDLAWNTAKLTWGASTDNVGVASYTIKYGTQTTTVAGNLTTVTLANLSASTTYPVEITAKDAEGNTSVVRTGSFATPVQPDTVAPSKPGTITPSAITNTSVNLSWVASTDNVGVTGYDVFNGTTKVGSSTGAATTAAITGLSPNLSYTLTVKAKDAAGNVSDGTNVSFNTPDTIAPTKPGGPTISDVKADSVKVSWTASTDARGVTGYTVKVGTKTVEVAGNVLTTTVTGLTDDTPYTVSVTAKDAVPNVSEAATGTFRTLAVPDTTAPTKPTLAVGVVTDTTIALSWSGATDNKGVTGYEVYDNGTRILTPTGTSVTVTGLTPGSLHKYTVKAKDAAGNLSAASNQIDQRTTGGGIVESDYSLTGSAVLKNLSKGTVSLTGSVASTWNTADGAFTADLQLNPTRGRLVALGFIPLTADIAFIQSGQTTGTLDDSTKVLKSKSTMKVRLPKVYLFGSIQLAGGSTCQTKRASEINLTSDANGFVAGVGGTLSGQFALSDLSGCGFLNGLVSPLTSGSGNTLSIKLAGK